MKTKKQPEWGHQDSDDKEPKEVYYKWFLCDNCGERIYIWIKIGVRVPRTITCENCGCESKTT